MRDGRFNHLWGAAMIAQRVAPIVAPRSLLFVIPGRLGGKGRHRSTIRAGKIATYTPKKTMSDEAVVRHFASNAMKQTRMKPLTGTLRLEAHIFRHYPKSWSAKRCANTVYISGKPDCDNSAKLLCDAMNGIAYQDDSQIAQLIFTRRYRVDEPECIRIFISELEAQ